MQTDRWTDRRMGACKQRQTAEGILHTHSQKMMTCCTIATFCVKQSSPAVQVVSLFPLFPGTNEMDQIEKIHAITGTPSPEILATMKRRSTHVEFDFPPKVPPCFPFLTIPYAISGCCNQLS